MRIRILLSACLMLPAPAPVLAQSTPAAAMFERAGWDALAAGALREAAETFAQAIAADPNNARVHLGAGTAAYLERRDADAQQALERALQLDPALTRARAVLGRVLYRRGDLAGAIRTYETLTREAPDDEVARAARVREASRPASLAALRTSFRGLTGRQAVLAYATSALAVRRLIDEAGGDALAALLRDLGEGADFEEAFARRMGRSFAEFQASFAAATGWSP